MKYIKDIETFNESLTPKDYTIFKIRYYSDAVNVVRGKFSETDEDRQQAWDRAKQYQDFFWKMVEKVTGNPHEYWSVKYFLSSTDCSREELHELYDIIIPESEEYYYWYIPNTMTDLIEWIKSECKLPFQIVQRAPYNRVIQDREKTTWRREEAEKFVKKHMPELSQHQTN